jgi:T-complex protein 1 subunit beta
LELGPPHVYPANCTPQDMSFSPVQILADEATQEKGDQARLSIFAGVYAVTDCVKTTLGPKGMDKILQSLSAEREIVVTNDGATILKSILLENPAAKILIDISKAQDDEAGDGTTSVCVLAGELLREAEQLVSQKIHPQIIVRGYRMAADAAREALTKSTRDNASNPEKFREDLLNIARTTLSSKIVSQEKEHFANIVVDAVLRLKGSTNLESIHFIKRAGGTLRDSYLDEGFILEKKIGVGQPKRLENPKILIANTAMDTDKVKIFGARVKVESPAELAKMEQEEKEKMLRKCQKIVDHGINCFINRQLIYNLPEQFFAERGVTAIEHADFDGIERLALVLGGEIVSTFDHPERVKLGSCKLIEEIFIGEDRMIKFSGVHCGEACTIVLRGASTHLLDESERSVHDALCVVSQTVKETRTVYGGGCSEVLMAKAVDELAKRTPGKVSLAIEAFARALRKIPTILADNAGYDSSELVAQLRAAHYEGKSTTGLDMKNGKVGDMAELGIVESFRVKLQVLLSASEAAEMILRVDDIIQAAPRKREQDPRYG